MLLSTSDITRAFDVHANTLARWREAEGFPEPRGRIGRRLMWAAGDVVDWARERGRLIPNPFIDEPLPSVE